MLHILWSMTAAQWAEAGLRLVVTCSVLHNVLPPWEAFTDFPTAQKYYKLLIYLIGYVALNLRSTVYSNISTANGTKTSAASNSAPPVISPIDPEK